MNKKYLITGINGYIASFMTKYIKTLNPNSEIYGVLRKGSLLKEELTDLVTDLVCYDKNKILASFSNLEFGKAKKEIQKDKVDELEKKYKEIQEDRKYLKELMKNLDIEPIYLKGEGVEYKVVK